MPEVTMVEQRPQTPDVRSIQQVITSLALGVERLHEVLLERQNENRSTAAIVVRTAERLDEIAATLTALQAERAQASPDLQGMAGRLGALEQRVVVLGDRPPLGSGPAPAPEALIEVERRLGADLEALRSSQADLQNVVDTLLKLQGPRQAGPSEEGEGVIHDLRNETLGAAMTSVNDLLRRVDKLERQHEALARIIDLVVERSKLAIGDESAQPHPR